ncbi:hypothetical protein MNBD_GAMMA10-3113 [hydrothermal vent metagenome]|uniref:Uncharacterized protein n=1 Tax=hydrothermal vent metagenome TaxID=652676 RepID=A0A3B0Y3J4_9ZZZZ
MFKICLYLTFMLNTSVLLAYENCTTAASENEYSDCVAALSVTTNEQLTKMEKRLKNIGFKSAWSKSGLNMSAYSLIGHFNKQYLRVSINFRYNPDTNENSMSVILKTVDPLNKLKISTVERLKTYLKI